MSATHYRINFLFYNIPIGPLTRFNFSIADSTICMLSFKDIFFISSFVIVNLDEPPFLEVGTDISAKYKGAFCEAKIQKISKTVKCKVQYSNGISTFVTDDAIKGQLKVGSIVDIKSSNKKKLVQATIKKIQDCSQYIVVFNDGDTACLKRTALCLKSGRYFADCATLDQLPLTHPEHIEVTPVRHTTLQVYRNRKHKTSSGESEKEEASAMEENIFGKVVCVEATDKKKIRDNWFPGLVVAPTSQTSIKINAAEDYLVRSFKDGKYYKALKKEITEFTKEIGARVENPTLKTAVEKALFFLDKDELPPHWDRDLLFGVNRICVAPGNKVIDNNNFDEASIEEKDYFVAQLFKFMDDRGTPLNQSPVINEKDVDLYKLFKVVNNCGGYNKVNKGKLWKVIATKAGHEEQLFFSVKNCYQQYLHSFEDFYRKLGCTMLSHPRGVRSHSKFSRNIIRDVDKTRPSTSSATERNNCAKNDLNGKKNKNSVVAKKTVKAIKAEEKLKKNEETSKKGDKKKENIANNTSRNKLSVKWNQQKQETNKLTETNYLVRNSKTKKEIKEILKIEVKKEIDSNTVDDDKLIEDKKIEKKIFTRNLFGKSVQKTTNKEKVIKVKSANTGLPGMRNMKALKEQIKTYVTKIIPLKKSKRGTSNTQQDASNKGKPVEEVPKLTRSKTKEDLPTKSRRVSVLNDLADRASVVQLTQPGLLVENLIKIKKKDQSEKKKTLKKKKNKKEDRVALKDIIPTTTIKNEPFDPNSPVVIGDNLVLYYGDNETYEAKVINECDVEGVMRYYVHYIGWNSRYDEWIDVTRIAYKTKNPGPRPKVVNDADFSKSSPLEQKNVDSKKVPSTTNKTKRSVTPLRSTLNIKKSAFSSTRPIRSCTLTYRPLVDIDNSDSGEEYTAVVAPSKQYRKKKIIKSEPDVIIKTESDFIMKTESLDTNDEEQTLYPKTYPSKEVNMRRRKLKSCVFNVHSIKSEEIKVCEPAFDLNLAMQLPSDSMKPNEVNENVEVKNESKIDNSIKIEPEIAPEIAPNHYLSPREKSEKNCPEHNMSEFSNNENEENRIKSKLLTIPTMSEIASIVYCPSSPKNEEQNQLNKVTDFISTSLDDKSNESKISGTDLDLNKIRSEMKGLIPTSTNSNYIIQNTELFMLDQQIAIEVSKINEPITDDVYEFKESKSSNFNAISSVTEEKICRSMRHNSLKLFNFEKPDELSKVIYSPVREELVEQNMSMIPFVPNSNNFYLSDNNVKITVDEEFNIINKIQDPIMENQSDNESYEYQNLGSDITVVTSNIKEIEQHCQVNNNVPNLKYKVSDLCLESPESPTNILSMPEHIKLSSMIIEEEYDDDEDDDESKLVIAENDNIEIDYPIDSDSDLVVISEEHNSSNGQIDENIETYSLSPLPPSVHTNIELDCKSSSQVKEEICTPKNTDYESSTSFNESIQSSLIQSYQIYSNFENHSSQNGFNMDNIDDSTKSGFDSISKLPTIENKDIIETATKLLNEPLINNKPNKCDFEIQNSQDEKEKMMGLLELQCREEIVDEDTLNNVLVIEYNCKAADYDIHKPSTSKGFFDSIHQPGTIKDSFYETNNSYVAKNSFFEATQVVKSDTFDTNVSEKSSYFDPNIPSCSKNYFYDHNIPSTSKSSIYENSLPSTSKSFYENSLPSTSKSFYENSLPSTSKSFYNPESDVSSVLFCEETIPGSSTGTLGEQYDQEQRKKALQALFEEREAASAIYAMNKSFCRPMITLKGATEEETKEYTKILQKDEAILDKQHLQLAQISARKLGINVNEPSVTKPLETEPEIMVESMLYKSRYLKKCIIFLLNVLTETMKPPEKLQSKRRINRDEKPPKRSKCSTTTAPIPPGKMKRKSM
ncbi:hypothetical protein QTP88_007212 [Uroleucon formosanum]